MIALAVTGFILAASAHLVPAAPLDTPPYGPRYPSENFGVQPFSATVEQLQEGRKSQIVSTDQRNLWVALVSLLGSQHGYHSAEEIASVLGVKLTMSVWPSGKDDTARWDADLPHAHLTLLESGPESKLFGQSSSLSIHWDDALDRPNCISALKAFAAVQDAGGRGFQRVAGSRTFRLRRGGEVTIASPGMSEQTCLSDFLLNGHVSP